MQIVKIVIGSILGLSSLMAISEMVAEESGASLVGALIGFVLIGGFSAWLIYSGVNKTNKNQ